MTKKIKIKVMAVITLLLLLPITLTAQPQPGSLLLLVARIEMVWIPAGTFTRGSNDRADRNASPAHQVTLTEGFYMGKYEVTQTQWAAVMTGNTNDISANPSEFSSSPAAGERQENRPVEQVSWYDILVFCNRLSMREGLTPAYRINNSTNPDLWGTVPYYDRNDERVIGDVARWNAVTIVANSTGYRLPTEAQWEYACRAGTTTAWSYGNSANGDFMWFYDNSNVMTHEVGRKRPNTWGLHDMHGNVWEWCWDWFGNYTRGAQTNPTGASSRSLRIYRGGSWASFDAESTRSAYRNIDDPYIRVGFLGFRLVRP